MEVTNIAGISGILVGKQVNKGTGRNGEYVSVELTLRTDDNSEHRVKMFSNKLTKDGNVSKLYESTMTVANEYKSADIVGLENADRIHVNQGEISINRYMSRMGDLVETTQFNAKFCNRHENGDFKSRAEFSLVGVVDSVIPKVDEEGETELLKVRIYVPRGFNKQVELIEVVIRNKEAFDYITDNFQKWEVVKVGGQIINRAEEKKTLVETVGFGVMPELKTSTIRVRELLATGGQVLEGMNEQALYTQEEIQEGINLLNQKIVEIKSKVNSSPQSTPVVGFGQVPPPNPQLKVDMTKIPF